MCRTIWLILFSPPVDFYRVRTIFAAGILACRDPDLDNLRFIVVYRLAGMIFQPRNPPMSRKVSKNASNYRLYRPIYGDNDVVCTGTRGKGLIRLFVKALLPISYLILFSICLICECTMCLLNCKRLRRSWLQPCNDLIRKHSSWFLYPRHLDQIFLNFDNYCARFRAVIMLFSWKLRSHFLAVSFLKRSDLWTNDLNVCGWPWKCRFWL